MITNTAIYKIKKKLFGRKIVRRTPILKFSGIVYSNKSSEFTILVNSEFDYRFQILGSAKDKVIKIITCLFCEKSPKKKMAFYFTDEIHLK
jgi:hypothetical protein